MGFPSNFFNLKIFANTLKEGLRGFRKLRCAWKIFKNDRINKKLFWSFKAFFFN